MKVCISFTLGTVSPPLFLKAFVLPVGTPPLHLATGERFLITFDFGEHPIFFPCPMLDLGFDPSPFVNVNLLGIADNVDSFI
jgi:hypothetical protein